MPVNEIHQNDIGTIFEITLKDDAGVVDLTGATTLNILFKKPDEAGTIVTKPGVPDADPKLGILRYTTIAEDLDVPGGWKVQVFLVLPGGSWSSDVGGFTVHENLS